MHLYDESTPRRKIWRAQINWSKPRTFSERQSNYIRDYIPHKRGVYCIYSRDRVFEYVSDDWPTRRWSHVIYVGSGWIDDRLCAHLNKKKNQQLEGYLRDFHLLYRFDKIYDDDPELDWPKTVEASLLHLFEHNFGELPPANRRRETMPELPLHNFIVQERSFSFLKRG
jgi:hypothetical protein